ISVGEMHVVAASLPSHLRCYMSRAAHAEAEVQRRGQIDSVSSRVFDLERKLAVAEEERRDAIDKANATFLKQHNEAAQDRQNFAAAILQVNRNFEQVSSEMTRHESLARDMQKDMAEASSELQRHDRLFAALQQGFLVAEQTLQARSGGVPTQRTAVQRR
ncbi:unnamed protein product, partial [Prorocentrum cordatum]